MGTTLVSRIETIASSSLLGKKLTLGDLQFEEAEGPSRLEDRGRGEDASFGTLFNIKTLSRGPSSISWEEGSFMGIVVDVVGQVVVAAVGPVGSNHLSHGDRNANKSGEMPTENRKGVACIR